MNWEYLVDNVAHDAIHNAKKDFRDILNVRGEDGWEMIHMFPSSVREGGPAIYRVIFKRAKVE